MAGNPYPYGVSNPAQLAQVQGAQQMMQNFGQQPRPLMQQPAAPLSFAPPPNGQTMGPTTPLNASGNGGRQYTPNYFAQQGPTQNMPVQPPPRPSNLQAMGMSPQLQRQQAQALALRSNPRVIGGHARV
jgi:hypothetical protein